MAGPQSGSRLDGWYRRSPDEIAEEKARRAQAQHAAFFAPTVGDQGRNAPSSAPEAAQVPPNRASLPRKAVKPYALNPRGAVATKGSDTLSDFMFKAPAGTSTGASIARFIQNRNDSKQSNWVGGDKYFHCKANCEAASMGPEGVAASHALSLVREALDPGNIRHPEDALADFRANRIGRREGAAHPERSCQESCASLRTRGLPEKY